jgi:hypothetical protein
MSSMLRVATQRAADQESDDHVVTLALESGPIRHRQEFLGLLASKPVAQPSTFLPYIRDVVEVSGLFQPDHSVASGFADQLSYRR